MDLNPGSGGDDTYTKCGAVNPGDPNAGEGLYNQSKLDSNNDGTPEDVDEACGDLPYVTSTKTITTITNLGGNMYNVSYAIVVKILVELMEHTIFQMYQDLIMTLQLVQLHILQLHLAIRVVV